jgi:PAS domain S-box-containing protein
MNSNSASPDRPVAVFQLQPQTLMRPERKAWLLFLLLILFILPLMAGTYWMDLQSRREIESEELQRNLIQARTLSALVQREFIAAQSLLTSVATRPAVRRAWARRDLASLENHLKQARELDAAFLFISVYETDGTLRVIVPADRIVGWNFAYRDWYRGVTAHWQPYISEVYETAAGSHPLVVAVAVPLRDEGDKPVGILMASYGLDQLARKFATLEKGSMGEFYVIDQHGVVAASRAIEPQDKSAHLPASPLLARALSSSERSYRLRVDQNEMFVGYAPVPQLGWGVIYSRPASEALAPAVRLGKRNRSVAFYVLLIYLITAAFAAFLVRRQTQMLAANQALNRNLEKHIFETRRAREELDRYFTLALDMMCIAGDDGFFKRLNPAWEKTLGFTVPELLAKPYLDFIHPDDRESTIQQAEKQKLGSEVMSFQNRYVCKDGSYRWLSWSATPVVDQKLIYAVARDITELKKVQDALTLAKEEAERTSKFKDQFLSTMSHELRTPLNAVLGFSDLLADERYGPLNDKQRRYINHIHTGGKHLLSLISDILDLSKIEAGRMELAMENLSVEAAFTEVRSVMQPLADKKSHVLSALAEPGLTVRADATRFKQVLMNLMGNAIKFTQQAGTIELASRLEGGKVRVEVRDNGPGIPLEEQKRIFEAFYRLRESGKKTEGTGLGLAITQRLVELHGGELSLESHPGQGSCFYFSLPAVASLQESRARKMEIPQTSSASQRILVIEDDHATAQLIQSQLSSAGYQVTVCEEPNKAQETAAELQPGAITLDIEMRPQNGWEVLTKLKQDPRTSHIPLLVVSIIDQPGMGALLGADEYLVKPVDKATLLAAIARYVSAKTSPRASGPILVVEDDLPTREFIVEMLTTQGYTVHTADNGAKARTQVAAALPDLVILDLMLPEVSGLELLGEWRASFRTASLPVFVLTSKDLSQDEQNYLRIHAEALFRKQQPWHEALIQHLQRIAPASVRERV